jgi:Sodium/hydrogen exchanger family
VRRRWPGPAASSPSISARWVLGNARLPHGPAIRGFAEGIAWLAQIGLFVMLGLLASPARLPAELVPALLAGSVLVLLARPVAVLACTLPVRVPRRQQAFLSWAGLRGAVPIVLATILMNARVPGATRLFDLVFIVVVINTILQGTHPALGIAAAICPWSRNLPNTRPHTVVVGTVARTYGRYRPHWRLPAGQHSINEHTTGRCGRPRQRVRTRHGHNHPARAGGFADRPLWQAGQAGTRFRITALTG